MNADVTAYVSSKDRYFTTLPTCIMSIINQTVKPQKFVLFLDGEKIDLRNNELYLGLFKLLDYYKIEWEVIFGEGKGQVLNHQKIIEIAKTEWIWRVDDDCFPETNVLETLFRYVDHIGAIAGLVIDPNNIKLLPDDVDGKIENIYNGQNVQWYLHKDDFCIEVDHLYSTFLYRKSAAKHGYCSELSPVGHREETIFTHQMKRNGFKLLVNPKCITWHCRQSQGGIRSYNNKEYYDADEKVFATKMNEWKIKTNTNKSHLILLNSGMGDHLMFKQILPEVKAKYPDLILSVCYNEVFEDCGVKLISIQDGINQLASQGRSPDEFDLYKWCWQNNWKGHFIDAMRQMYLK